MIIKVGHGYDVHRLVKDRDFILFGVKIDYKKGLLGHSDADVGVHAVIDSLLGAACLGSIGDFFPDNDEQYKNINSLILLKRTLDMLNLNNFIIGNIDCTIILQDPKISCYIKEMKTKIIDILNINFDQINIKAKTEEGLGFLGKGLGVAAHVVSLIYKQQ